MTDEEQREQLIEKLARNPRLAHATFFGHRHPHANPPFHDEIIELWHGPDEKVLVEAFRGAAKSTRAEEAIVIMAALRQFRNAIVLGETFDRAVDRLKAIKHEIENNEFIAELFGSLVGDTWTESRIVLSNGVCIQAVGQGQSLRGVKHLDARPDMAFADDIENEDSVLTPEARQKVISWLYSVVLPALDPKRRIRINGTPLNPESLIVRLSKDRSWVSRRYPIKYRDENGEWRPTWGERFPLATIDELEEEYTRLGLTTNFRQEYMCEAEDPAVKAFTADMFRVEPTVRTWHAVYCMYDPARTARTKSAGGKESADTGAVHFSWLNNRLIIWDAYGRKWKPDEIINDMFRADAEYSPVTIGVERDGLEEFILQPLRQEQLKRGYAIPIRAMKAPKGKLDFIRGLQPFFKAHEIIFAKDLPDLRAQLLAFPTGLIDIPNALAYALMLRPGQSVYENFSWAHVADQLYKLPRAPMYLAVNGTQMYTTAVLIQMVDGAFNILWDAVREGDPGATLEGMLRDANVEAGQKVKLFAPPDHFGNYDTIGLRGSARKVPVDLHKGGQPLDGRDEIRGLLQRNIKGHPALRVSGAARWALNAFSGGYCKEVLKTGMLTEFAVDGPYKTLMEGIESLAALLKFGQMREEQAVNWATATDGRRYISARPGRR